MQIITGDETGLIKILDLEKQSITHKYGVQSKEFRIIKLLKYRTLDTQFIIALRKQSIIILDAVLNEIAIQDIPSDPIDFFINNELNGEIVIIYRNRAIYSIKFDIDENQFTIPQSLNSKQFEQLPLDSKNYVTRVSISSDNNLLAFAYNGQAPNIFNIKQKQMHWTARNVRNDELDLVVKMHDVDALFLDDYSIGTITIRKTLRIYDITKQKSQPISEYQIKDSQYPLLRCKCYQNKYFISNLRGEILIYSTDMHLIGKTRGTLGSISEFDFHQDNLYTISADRNVRIHSLKSTQIELLQKFNISQRLVTFCLLESAPFEVLPIKREVPIWTILNGKQAKSRFEGMRKNTIKLPYLKKMFENHKFKKRNVKQEEIDDDVKQEIKQEVKQEYQKKQIAPIKRKTIDKQKKLKMLKAKQLTNKAQK